MQLSSQEFILKLNTLERKLNAFARSLTGDSEAAKDLVQETTYRAYRNISRYQAGTNFKAWVMTIMRNTFINQYRKKKNRNVHIECVDDHAFRLEDAAAGDQAMTNIRMKELKKMIESLDHTYNIPFMMHYQGYQYKEIASYMDLPVGTVKSRIFHARRQLKEKIHAQYGASARS